MMHYVFGFKSLCTTTLLFEFTNAVFKTLNSSEKRETNVSNRRTSQRQAPDSVFFDVSSMINE